MGKFFICQGIILIDYMSLAEISGLSKYVINSFLIYFGLIKSEKICINILQTVIKIHHIIVVHDSNEKLWECWKRIRLALIICPPVSHKQCTYIFFQVVRIVSDSLFDLLFRVRFIKILIKAHSLQFALHIIIFYE